MQQETLIIDLIQRVQQSIADAKVFCQFNEKQLNYKENDEKWSILECLEHLNLYGDFYLEEINNRILSASKVIDKASFKIGFLGNLFTKDMLPQEGKQMRTMKTFKDKNPKSSALPVTTIDRFIKQQETILSLLEAAKKVDLNKVRTNITILKLVSFL